MPFGKFLKKLFKKGGKDVAGKYLGEDAANAVDGLVDQGFDQLQIDEKIKGLGGEELVGVLMKGFSFAQQNNLQELYSSVSSGDTSVIAKKATEKSALTETAVNSTTPGKKTSTTTRPRRKCTMK